MLGFSGSSLQLKKNSFIAYDPNNKEDKVSEAWSNVGPYAYEYSPATVQDWIEYYTAVQFSKTTLDDISKYQEIKGEEITYIGAKSVYDELKLRMSSNNWAENPMILCFYCNVLNKTSGKIDKVSGHAVVPYKIVEDKNSVKIYVYDCNHPNDSERFIEFDKLTWKASNYDDWDKDGIKEQPFDFGMVSLKALNAAPEIPDHVTANLVGFANLLFTDSSGKQLGYYQGEFKDEITGVHRIINYGSGTGSESLESYYVPDSSIKMELYGKNEGTSNISMLTPNGAITASVPVSVNSVDEFKMLNDGKGVEFKSGSGTLSLSLTVSVETLDSAQIVYADFSQIGAGGSIDLSNIDDVVNIENDGQPVTCSLNLEQLGINTNSNDSIENIVIEGDSTIIIKPADWNDIANSEIVIEHDIGSDGSIESTETIRQKDTTPPSTVIGLESTADSSWINFAWTNPSDSDFNHTGIYLNGIFQTNTSAEYFNATGLQPETSYTISTRTTDVNGNVNETWVNSTATTAAELASDVGKPVIQSVVMFPTNTTAGATINISINATDNTDVTEVTAGDIQLTKTDGIWQGSITAPSSVGDYSLSIKANDTSGNTAETSVPYRVVQLSGGASIAVSPRSSNITAGNNTTLAIKVKNTQNIDDTFKVRISVSELPAAYQAGIPWFNWTEKVVTLRAGQEVQIPIEVNVPAGTTVGRKLFRANVNSETSSITGFDTGYLTVK